MSNEDQLIILQSIDRNARLHCWWLNKIKELGCKLPSSRMAYKNFSLPYNSFENSIIGYIEELEEKINDKQSNI